MKRLMMMIALLSTFAVAAAQDYEDYATGVCWFVADETTPVYADRDLTNIQLIVKSIPVGSSYPVVDIFDNRALLQADFETGFWVLIEKGTIFGDYCEVSTLYTAELVTKAHLWSHPDIVSGQVIGSLAQGTTVSVVGGAAVGRIRYDSLQTGIWYPVRVDNSSGWVWAGRLDFDTAAPETDAFADAFARKNARLWSEPDVVNGTRLLDIRLNNSVDIVGGPVTGRIRFDDETPGVWYQVDVNGILGWVWQDRLRFEQHAMTTDG